MATYLSCPDGSQVLWVPSILAQPIEPVVIEDKQIDKSDFDEFPTLNERLISWYGGLSQQGGLLFDRKLRQQVKIPFGVRGFHGDVCGHYLLSMPYLTQQGFEA